MIAHLDVWFWPWSYAVAVLIFVISALTSRTKR